VLFALRFTPVILAFWGEALFSLISPFFVLPTYPTRVNPSTLFQQASALCKLLAMISLFRRWHRRIAIGLVRLHFPGLERLSKALRAVQEAERFLLERVIIGKAAVGEIAKWLAERTQPARVAKATPAPSRSLGKKPQ